MANKWQWLAEVRVPTGGKKYHLSTGVPLSRRYVLTTGHGIPSKLGSKAEIRFIADFNAGRGWRKGEVAWHGGKAVDASLLIIEEFDEIQSFIYSGELPDESVPWEGAGFPCASKITDGELKGHRNSKGLSGKYRPGGGLKSQELDLSVDDRPKIPGKWAGISGAPVLYQRKLVGIIKSFKKDFDGDSLWAVSIRQLLRDESFCKCLGLRDREDLASSVRRTVKALLSASEDVTKAIGEQLMIADAPHHVEQVVDELFSAEIQIFEEIAHNVLKTILPGNERSLETLENLLNLMLPLLYDQDIVNSVHSELVNSTFVRLPVKTRTVAEIIMAAVGGRRASYRKPVGGDSWPVGSTLIEPPPETGFSDPQRGLVAAFDQFMLEKLVDAEDRDADLNILRELINDGLAWIAKKFGGEDSYRHYFIHEQKDNREVKHEMETLKNAYPQIIFVVLAGDPGLLPHERRLARPLRAILAARKGEQTE